MTSESPFHAAGLKGRLWIGTGSLGLQVFDLGETLNPPQTNLRDPLFFNPGGDGVAEAYLDTARGLASDHVTGITFQAFTPAPPEGVAWISGVPVPPSTLGGVSRFDANAANDDATVVDERVTVFRPDPGNGPASDYVSSAAADGAGNVWFGTTVPGDNGVSRFGNAGILSLDSANYVNTTATATVTLQDDGLNGDPAVRDLSVVRVASASDAGGFPLILTETGPDTGVFSGSFGFTNGASGPAATKSPAVISKILQSTIQSLDVKQSCHCPFDASKATL